MNWIVTSAAVVSLPMSRMAQFNYHTVTISKGNQISSFSSLLLSASERARALRNANVAAGQWLNQTAPQAIWHSWHSQIDNHQSFPHLFNLHPPRFPTSLFIRIDIHRQKDTNKHSSSSSTAAYRSQHFFFFFVFLCTSNYTLEFDLCASDLSHKGIIKAQLAKSADLLVATSTSLDNLRYIALAHWSPLNASHFISGWSVPQPYHRSVP